MMESDRRDKADEAVGEKRQRQRTNGEKSTRTPCLFSSFLCARRKKTEKIGQKTGGISVFTLCLGTVIFALRFSIYNFFHCVRNQPSKNQSSSLFFVVLNCLKGKLLVFHI